MYAPLVLLNSAAFLGSGTRRNTTNANSSFARRFFKRPPIVAQIVFWSALFRWVFRCGRDERIPGYQGVKKTCVKVVHEQMDSFTNTFYCVKILEKKSDEQSVEFRM